MVDKITAVLSPEPEVPALKIIGEVQALHVTSEHDVIVINIKFPVSAQEVENTIAMWRKASLLPNPVVCLVNGVDVNVVRPGVKA